jgi:hypothetical protein
MLAVNSTADGRNRVASTVFPLELLLTVLHVYNIY